MLNTKERLSDEELRLIDAKEVKAWEVPKDAKYVGSVMYPYGDMSYYRLPDGSYICNYFSIGD